MEQDQKSSSFNIPTAIIVAGLIIAGAIFYTKGAPRDSLANTNNPDKPAAVEFVPVNADDHLLGKPDADIVAIEYSDFECYFCKKFQPTVEKLVEDYGKKGQLAWVYRHFPLTQIHPNAQGFAEASECVATLGGNTKFWDFVSLVFKSSEENGSLAKLNTASVAKSLGLNEKSFSDCVTKGEKKAFIANSFELGLKAGVNGTPATVLFFKKPLSKAARAEIEKQTASVMTQSGEKLVTVVSDSIISTSGALPYEIFKGIFDLAVK